MWGYASTSPYVLMLRCLIKLRDNFTFAFTFRGLVCSHRRGGLAPAARKRTSFLPSPKDLPLVPVSHVGSLCICFAAHIQRDPAAERCGLLSIVTHEVAAPQWRLVCRNAELAREVLLQGCRVSSGQSAGCLRSFHQINTLETYSMFSEQTVQEVRKCIVPALVATSFRLPCVPV